MSALFDVPVQLALVLSLAASAGGPDDPIARTGAQTSPSAAQTSATYEPLEGPFRFSEGIWLRALKETGTPVGARSYAGRIFQTSGGRFYVPSASERDEILRARWDVAAASRVARAFAEINSRRMRPALGRDPTSGDLYLAHLFGPETAISFIKLAASKPNEPATAYFQDLLATAPEIMFDDGKPVSVATLYQRFTGPLRETRALSQAGPAVGGEGGAAVAGLALKPTLLAPEPDRDDHMGSLALAWRSEVKGAGGSAPLQ